jgi:hypothetical protein
MRDSLTSVYLQNSIAALVSKIFAFEGSTIKGAILPIALEESMENPLTLFCAW